MKNPKALVVAVFLVWFSLVLHTFFSDKHHEHEETPVTVTVITEGEMTDKEWREQVVEFLRSFTVNSPANQRVITLLREGERLLVEDKKEGK